jgi:hypothetical protein
MAVAPVRRLEFATVFAIGDFLEELPCDPPFRAPQS